ncbi:hypothetical protein RBA42_24930, partial [Mycobacteroides abscessus subsp. abscessus]
MIISALPERMRAEHIECRIIDTTGNVWHLSGPNAGVEGAMINGAIDGLGEIPGKGVWSETANSAPSSDVANAQCATSARLLRKKVG